MQERRTRPYLSTQANLYTLVAISAYLEASGDAAVPVTASLDGKEILSGVVGPRQAAGHGSRSTRGEEGQGDSRAPGRLCVLHGVRALPP